MQDEQVWVCEECRKPWNPDSSSPNQCRFCGNRTRVPLPVTFAAEVIRLGEAVEDLLTKMKADLCTSRRGRFMWGMLMLYSRLARWSARARRQATGRILRYGLWRARRGL